MTQDDTWIDALPQLRDWVRWGASRFAEAGLHFGHGTDNALDEAYALVLHALHLPFDLPAVYLESHLTPEERRAVHALLQRRLDTRMPAAYLMGEIRFAGLSFEVGPDVLIPRSPFAELIERRFAPWLTVEPYRILDLCTGSGCIGIATAMAFEEARVDLADLSPAALAVAARNVARHGLQERVRVIASDGFEALEGEHYDLILCNPPYVSEAEWQTLPPEYHHEPRMALAAGADGMDLVARILRDAAAYLHEGGWLFCEVGGSQEAFEARWPDLPVTWAAFERGGDGVFCIDREALAAHFGEL